MGMKYQGTGYANGFNPNVKKPLDLRTVVDTKADRNSLEYTYPGMRVVVLGPAVAVGGVDTYPQAEEWKLIADRATVYGGPTTQDQDWKRADAPVTVAGAGYKGPWDAAANFPNLNDAALKATLVAGDFYKVSVPGNTVLNSVSNWTLNDSVFWDGTRFDKFENTNPNAVQPLYASTEGARFQDDVLNFIRLNAITAYVAGRAYKINSYVKNSYTENGVKFVDTFLATSNMGIAEAALPTYVTPNPGWELISTTNLRKLPGFPVADDTVGRPATGSYTPASRTPGNFLTAEEVDARIDQYGGKIKFIDGGDAFTYSTADRGELPSN